MLPRKKQYDTNAGLGIPEWTAALCWGDKGEARMLCEVLCEMQGR